MAAARFLKRSMSCEFKTVRIFTRTLASKLCGENQATGHPFQWQSLPKLQLVGRSLPANTGMLFWPEGLLLLSLLQALLPPLNTEISVCFLILGSHSLDGATKKDQKKGQLAQVRPIWGFFPLDHRDGFRDIRPTRLKTRFMLGL